VFGEMGLMTGAPRSATVIARSDVDCYRLDKAGFEGILRQRPEIAEHMSHVLADRLQQNAAVASEFEAQHSAAPRHRADILERIRHFFGLDESASA
jgi:CRP-like cAMP-binding protein